VNDDVGEKGTSGRNRGQRAVVLIKKRSYLLIRKRDEEKTRKGKEKSQGMMQDSRRPHEDPCSWKREYSD